MPSPPRRAWSWLASISRLAHDLHDDVAGDLAPARQPHLGEVIDVTEVLALLVGVGGQVLRAGDDAHAAQPARALADARRLDSRRHPRAGVEDRLAGGAVDDEVARRVAGAADRHARHHAPRPTASARRWSSSAPRSAGSISGFITVDRSQ